MAGAAQADDVAGPAPAAMPTKPAAGRRARPRSGRTSVTDDAITRIRQMILTGDLAPGERLPPEADLAARLGLSRTSLREAVRALTVLGVIDTRQGDGTYVTALGPELLLGALGLAVDLQREEAIPDLVAVRRILEPAATALAATRMSRADLELLRGYIHPEVPESEARTHIGMDVEFHRAIARASGNQLLAALLEGLAAPTVRMRIWRAKVLPGVVERSLVEHQAIVDALEAGDAELARAAATMHIAAVENWVCGLAPGWSALAAQEQDDHHREVVSPQAAR